jgi:hypothetical protein
MIINFRTEPTVSASLLFHFEQSGVGGVLPLFTLQIRLLFTVEVLSTSFLDPVFGHDEAGLSPNTKVFVC